MAVILGLIVTVEVMIAGGMIFNIDFHSADIVAIISSPISFEHIFRTYIRFCIL